MALQLETQVRPYRRVYLYGSAKTLKTTTAVKFPNPIVAQDTEMRGADFLPVARVTIDTIGDLQSFVADLQGERYQTVVLDDFANAVRRWTAAASAGAKDPRAGYKAVYQKVIPALQKLLARQSHLVITGHFSKEMELPANSIKERAWVHPNLPDALETYVLGFFDVIAYCYNNGTPSALVIESATPERRIVAGCRAGLPFSNMAAQQKGIVTLAALPVEVVK